VLDILRKARIPLDRRVTLWEMMLNLCCVYNALYFAPPKSKKWI